VFDTDGEEFAVPNNAFTRLLIQANASSAPNPARKESPDDVNVTLLIGEALPLADDGLKNKPMQAPITAPRSI